MSRTEVVLADLCMQLAQQIALAVFTGARLFRRGGEAPVLAIPGKIGQSHLELNADEVREVAPVGVIHFHRIVRLVGLPSESDIGRRGLYLLVEIADHRMMVCACDQARQRSYESRCR